ncbi:hypothetical protein KP509_25G042400 [Ceratopteris richardii]|uniref:DUF642 domain-containing protein n=1 Tax=Ceratopteris richardii TaxID=49495 RepID=A0A8T2RQL7_CERRI|nr:hypothetical protein KP509_25G042400 [Ceratopteris richardii]
MWYPTKIEYSDGVRRLQVFITTEGVGIALVQWLWWWCWALRVGMVQADSVNLVDNGNFERMDFVLGKGSKGIWEGKGMTRLDVEAGTPAAVGAIPGWRVVAGGVQVLSNADYASASANSSFCIHLNSFLSGPGTLRTMPLLVSPHLDALYNLTFSAAAHPDGGSASRSLNVSVFRKRSLPETKAMPSITSSSSSRTFIPWTTYSLFFTGTDQNTYVEFASTTAGKYGIILDDVKISLVDVNVNGAFDSSSLKTMQHSSEHFLVLKPPSTAISNWLVTSNSIKYSKSDYSSSEDMLSGFVDLNAHSSGAILSSIPSRMGSSYELLFDYAGNPQASIDAFLEDSAFLVTIEDQAQGTILSSEAVPIAPSSISSDISNITWTTGTASFMAIGNYTKFSFISQIKGAYGPLLAKIRVYEIPKEYST